MQSAARPHWRRSGASDSPPIRRHKHIFDIVLFCKGSVRCMLHCGKGPMFNSALMANALARLALLSEISHATPWVLPARSIAAPAQGECRLCVDLAKRHDQAGVSCRRGRTRWRTRNIRPVLFANSRASRLSNNTASTARWPGYRDASPGAVSCDTSNLLMITPVSPIVESTIRSCGCVMWPSRSDPRQSSGRAPHRGSRPSGK